ncbi:hypothetical protein QUF99_12195 [Bacillus sp. DX4.1]|uniref:LptM family lipoprotein n=1 Tax=Bacillus sp. DX4.1 TaxID=3055867 RepID=UPI0025A11C83|nr:hypothetical protein [Bacillus sp. DX4.1]MDM5188052.1 hypothetical protein [Bacillus sp. DX4.1]
MIHRKTLSILTLITTIFTLSACGEKEAAKSVETKQEIKKDNVTVPKKESKEEPKKKEGQIGIQTKDEELKEHVDKNGYIFYTEHPIRRVTSDDGKRTNIFNYGDSFINLNTEEPLVNLPKEYIPKAFSFVTDYNDPSFQYRTWDETTNLERALIKTVFVSFSVFRILDVPGKQGDFSSPEIKDALSYIQRGGSFEYAAPAPQSQSDIGLYEKCGIMKKSWEQLAAVENPENNKDAFKDAYANARQETNNMILMLNILLSKNAEERLAKYQN